MKNTTARAKKFVRRHKSAIIVASIAIPVIVLQHEGIKSLNAFLAEHDLFDTYYFLED